MPASGWRIPAGEIEHLVHARLASWLGQQATLVATFEPLLPQHQLRLRVGTAGDLALNIDDRTPTELRQLLIAIDVRIALREDGLELSLCPAQPR